MALISTRWLVTLLTLTLGGVLPALFLPWGLPAAWLLAGTVLAVGSAHIGSAAPVHTVAARRSARILALCFAAYLASFVVTTVYHGGPMRELDKAIRFGLGIVLVLSLARTRLDPAALRSVIVLAAAVALGYALYDRLVNHAARVGGFMNEIQFGVLAAQVAMVNVVLALDAWPRSSRQAAVFSGGALAAVLATLMSGSLTAIVSLAALPICLVITRWRRPSSRAMLLGALALSVILGTLIQTRSQIVQRAVAAVDEVAQYRQFKSGAVAFSSNGARIENFQNAWRFFLSAPLMGVGGQGYLTARKEQVRRGELTPYTGGLGVAHNEFLDAMAKRGLVGLAGVLILLLGSMWLFRSLCERGHEESQPWAFAGMTICLGLFFASLTQNVLTHSTGANFLVLAASVFLALSLQSANAQTGRR